MSQISFEKYNIYYDHPNFKAVKRKLREFDFYITEDDVVRFFATVEFMLSYPKVPMMDIVYGIGQYTPEIFNDLQQLEKIAKDLLLRGKISAKLFNGVNSKSRILTTKLIGIMYDF